MATESIELNEDEKTVLMIADQGEYLAPIGRWQKPIERLTSLGLMHQLDSVNFVITANGRTALRQEEARDDKVLAGLFTQAQAVQSNIQDFAEQAANLLASAAEASSRVTGDTPAAAIHKWSDVIKRRAVDILNARGAQRLRSQG